MGWFSNNDTHLTYRYRVRKITFLNDGSEIDVEPHRITGIEIDNNYEDNYFPIIKVSLALNTYSYYKILNVKNTCKVFLRVTKYAIKNNNPESVTPETLIINQSFNLIMSEGTDNIYDSVKRREETGYTKINKDIEPVTLGDENPITFYLYADNVLTTRNIFNDIFTNVTVSDVITKTLNESKIKKVFMIPPDNINSYDEFLIPPLPLLDSLSFIDTYYGIYKSGSIIYFDFDKCYIVPYNGKPYKKISKMKDSDITNIVIPVTVGSSLSSSTGNIIKADSGENFIAMNGESLSVDNQSITNNYIRGNDLMIIDGIDGSNTIASDARAKDINYKNTYENKTMNDFIGSMYTSQTTAISDIVTIKLDDYDFNNIGLDKQLHLVFEDSKFLKKYAGNYILSGIRHNFYRQGMEMSLSSFIMMKKT